jgi:O-Antigen ligase
MGVRSKGHAALPLVLKLIIVCLFVPQAFSFYVLGLRLTLTRVILLALTPILIARLSSTIATGRYRFVVSDLFVPLAGLWMFVGVSNTSDLSSAIAHAGPIALEFCIGYTATRVMLRRHGQAVSFANLLCCVIAIVAILGLLDPLLGHYVIKDWANALTGYVTKEVRLDYRIGLLRAAGPVEHPILYGYACAVGLLLALSVRVTARAGVILACALGAFFSFSSAPIMCIVLGVGLLVYDRIFMGVAVRWWVLISLVGTLALAILSIANAPFSFIFRNFTFDPMSGYERLLQWQIAGDWLLQASPWFGLGYPEIVYPIPRAEDLTSIDSLWLGLGVAFGIPASVFVGLSMIGACFQATSGRGVKLTMAESRLARTLSIVLFLTVFLGFTVTLWGATWILSGLLTGLRANLGELARVET